MDLLKLILNAHSTLGSSSAYLPLESSSLFFKTTNNGFISCFGLTISLRVGWS